MSELSSLSIDGFHRDINRKAPHGAVGGGGGIGPCVFSLLRCKRPFLNPASEVAAFRLQGSVSLKLPGTAEQSALALLAATFFLMLSCGYLIGKELQISETSARRCRSPRGFRNMSKAQKRDRDQDHTYLPYLSN